MRLNIRELRDAIADELGAGLSGVHVCTHGGRFDLGELRRIATKTPALVVTCLGANSVGWVGGSSAIQYHFAAFILTKDIPGLKRADSGLSLTQVTLARIAGNRWNASNTRLPEGLRAENLYSGDLDRQGVSLWAVSWTQDLLVSPQAADELEDLQAIAADWRNTEGRNVASDFIEFEQEKA